MKSIHYIQHVPFEDPGFILDWANKNSITTSATHLYKGEKFPDYLETDLLVVMGGPMNIYEYDIYPWLKQEKMFLEKEIEQGTKIIGICLGAQLLADVLGAKVYPGEHKEIGWLPIDKTIGAKTHSLFSDVPDTITAMHWHGDTFEIPKNAVSLFTSEACPAQGFIYNDSVIGFQFHIETTGKSLNALLENCRDELREGKYIHTEEQILHDATLHMKSANKMLEAVLNKWI